MAEGAMTDGVQHFTRSESGRITPPSPLDLAYAKKSFKQDYKVNDKDVLGEGMNGRVVTAQHKRTGRRVAVKSFKLDQLSRRQRVDLIREIQIQSSMDHPNIARLYELYRSRQHARLVLEHLEGGDLSMDLQHWGPRSESEVALIVKQVLRAVEHIHNHGAVHRDIKLENLVYESKDRDEVKLIDFGLSCFWQEGMKPLEQFCGTPGCMAPEVETGKYTSKADLWSVGVVAYNLLTGMHFVMDEASCPVFPESLLCKPDAQNFIAALLTADPARRLSASEALKHSWIQSAGSSRVQPKSSGLTPSASRAMEIADPVNADLALRTLGASSPAEGAGEESLQQTTGADAVQTVKKSVWKNIFPAAMLKSSKASALWAALRRRKAAARVAPEMQIVPCHSD